MIAKQTFRIKLVLTLFLFVFGSNHPGYSQLISNSSFEIKQVIELKDIIFHYERSYISTDNNENFIVADPAQGIFMIFDSGGHLIQEIGRHGRGPGEFEQITHVEHLKNGNFLASDFSGMLHLFDAHGKVINSYNTSISPLMKFTELNENFILIPGIDRRSSDFKLLHLLNIESGEIERSFFESPFQMGDYGGILYSAPSVVSAIADEQYIYAFISFLNNMYIFDFDGKLIRSIEGIDFEYFSILENQNGPLTDSEKIEIMSSYTAISNLFWKDENSILIQHWRPAELSFQPLSFKVIMNLAEIDLDGNILFEEKNTPRLFGYNQRKNTFYLQDFHSVEKGSQNIIEVIK